MLLLLVLLLPVLLLPVLLLLLLLLLLLPPAPGPRGRSVCVWSRHLGRRDVPPPPRHRHRGRTADAAARRGGGRGRRPLMLILLLGRRLLRRLLLVPVLLVPILLVASVRLLRLLWRLLAVVAVAVLRVPVRRRRLPVLPVAVLCVPVRRRRLPVVGVAILRGGLILAWVAVAAVLLLLLLRGRLLLGRALRGRHGFRVDVLPLLRILVLREGGRLNLHGLRERPLRRILDETRSNAKVRVLDLHGHVVDASLVAHDV